MLSRRRRRELEIIGLLRAKGPMFPHEVSRELFWLRSAFPLMFHMQLREELYRQWVLCLAVPACIYLLPEQAP